MKQITSIIILLSVVFFVSKANSQQNKLSIVYNYYIKNYNHEQRTFEVKSNKVNTVCIYKSGVSAGLKTKEGFDIVPRKNPERVIYKSHKDDYFISQEIISGKDFYTKEPLNQIQWQLTGNTKTILKYNCQEATATFRGRDYMAYFTTELPFKAAPFKFYGLPGVMLQIITKDEQITIEATTLKVQPLTKQLTNPFKNKKAMSWEEFVVIYKKKNKEYNEKHKINMQFNFKHAKEVGAIASNAKMPKIDYNVAEESRLDIIVPGNDLSYVLKQIKKSLQNGN